MIKYFLLIVLIGINVCSADQLWWNRLQRVLCADENGNNIYISDKKLENIYSKCEINDKSDNKPIQECTDTKFETPRDILEEFCKPDVFSCVKNKPLLKEPEQIKEQLVECIEKLAKTDLY